MEKTTKVTKTMLCNQLENLLTLFLFVDDAATALAVKTIELQIQDLN